MRLPILALVGAFAIIPVAASAQDDAAQRRMDAMQRRADQADQQRRTDEIDRRVDTLDLRMRTQQTQRELDIQSSPPVTQTQPWISPAAPALPQDLAEAAERRRAALDASNARLRSLSEGQNR